MRIVDAVCRNTRLSLTLCYNFANKICKKGSYHPLFANNKPATSRS